ncbi:MAG TPA: STAS domain-containing protein [Terriglobia bacterium]|nr:STAS domain-containing protein [Terriglobia bacterium]
MKISRRRTEKTAILDLEGKIDLQTSPEFRKVLLETLQFEPLVMVNLQHVEYIDSSGIASLVEGYRESTNLQKRILLYGLGPMVRNVLELTHLTKVFEIYETEEQAEQAASLKR